MKHDQINQLLIENQEKSTMAERITQLEEELRQERAKNLTRRFMPPTVSGRRNYYGLWTWTSVTTSLANNLMTYCTLSTCASLLANVISNYPSCISTSIF